MVGRARPRRLRHRGLPNLAPQDGFSRLDGAHANAAENVKTIRALQGAAAAETKAHFTIEPEGSFHLDMLMIEASRA